MRTFSRALGRRGGRWLFCLVGLTCARDAAAGSKLRVLKVAVENSSADDREREDIVLRVADLARVAPDFTPQSCLVTATDAATVEADARVLEAAELPSQADDLDGDGKLDEIAFQVSLPAHKTRLVTVAYGDGPTIARLHGHYEKRTDAVFSKKFEGPAWESDLVAFRLYFDKRNAIDLFGKR